MISNMFSEVEKLRMGMDASWMRSEAIANNIASNDIPGYNRVTVAFEDYYRAALMEEDDGFVLKRTRDKHMQYESNIRPRIVQDVDEETVMRMDDNNVDIEKEMTDLTANTLYYYTLQSKVASEFSQLSTAITGQR